MKQRVTVVIPTIGRETLNRAIRTAIDQVDVETEVIVAWDGPPGAPQRRLLHADWGDRICVLDTGGGRRGAAARDMATAAGSAEWVAYLDDDDFWFPTKLRRQIETATGDLDVVSCRMVQFGAADGVISAPTPSSVYEGDVPLSTWLFRNRRLSGQRNHLQTSTLFMRRSLAMSVGWVTGARRHEDWGFVLRAVSQHGARIVQLPESLVGVLIGSENSVSNRATWRESLEWMELHSSDWDPGTRADFLLGQPLRYALQARDLEGARTVAGRLRSEGRPSLRAYGLAAAGLLNRSQLERLMLMTGRPNGDGAT